MSALDARLLAALRGSAVHLTAAELGPQLNTGPAEIETSIAELRAAGFDIELRPGFGYRLLQSPDRLIADDIQARLMASAGAAYEEEAAFPEEIVVFEETGSTNDAAMQRGRHGAAGPIAIFAERQSSGRGRFGRRWASASHLGLWFSLLYRPELPLAEWPRLTTWAAVSVADAFEETTRTKAAIKWPNDVFLSGKKAAGILIEMGVDALQEPFAVVGIGINVNHSAEDFPEELAETAISLQMATGRAWDRAELAASLLKNLHARSRFLSGDFPTLVSEATRRSALLGRWVSVRSGEEVIEGVAERLDDNGQLVLRQQDGLERILTAGEVTFHGK